MSLRDFDDPFWDQPSAKQYSRGTDGRKRLIKPLHKTVPIRGWTNGILWRADIAAGQLDDGSYGWTSVPSVRIEPTGGDILESWEAIGRDIRRELTLLEGTRTVISAIRGQYASTERPFAGLHREDPALAYEIAGGIWRLLKEQQGEIRRQTSAFIADAFDIRLTQANELIKRARQKGHIPPVARRTKGDKK